MHVVQIKVSELFAIKSSLNVKCLSAKNLSKARFKFCDDFMIFQQLSIIKTDFVFSEAKLSAGKKGEKSRQLERTC